MMKPYIRIQRSPGYFAWRWNEKLCPLHRQYLRGDTAKSSGWYLGTYGVSTKIEVRIADF